MYESPCCIGLMPISVHIRIDCFHFVLAFARFIINRISSMGFNGSELLPIANGARKEKILSGEKITDLAKGIDNGFKVLFLIFQKLNR